MKTSRRTKKKVEPRRVAFFAGSFDPFTVGHEDIVVRALKLFDEVIIAIGFNPSKRGFMPVDMRKEWIEESMAEYEHVRVISFTGLAAQAACREGACCFIKGVRTVQDYEYEMQMAQANRELCGLDTVLFFSSPQYAHVSSTLLRELLRNRGNVGPYIPTKAPEEMFWG